MLASLAMPCLSVCRQTCGGQHVRWSVTAAISTVGIRAVHYLAEQQPMVSIQSHYVCQATHAQELALLHGLVAEAARQCLRRVEAGHTFFLLSTERLAQAVHEALLDNTAVCHYSRRLVVDAEVNRKAEGSCR